MTAPAKPPVPPPPLLSFKGTVVGVTIAATPTGSPDVEVVVRGPSNVPSEGSRLCWRCPPDEAPRVGSTLTITVAAA